MSLIVPILIQTRATTGSSLLPAASSNSSKTSHKHWTSIDCLELTACQTYCFNETSFVPWLCMRVPKNRKIPGAPPRDRPLILGRKNANIWWLEGYTWANSCVTTWHCRTMPHVLCDRIGTGQICVRSPGNVIAETPDPHGEIRHPAVIEECPGLPAPLILKRGSDCREGDMVRFVFLQILSLTL